MYTEQLSQALGFVGSVIPGTAATGSSLTTEAIDLSKFRRYLFTLQLGAVATSGAAQILVQGAIASAGTYTTISALTSNVLTGSGAVQSELTDEGIVSLNLGYKWAKGVINVTGANVSGVGLTVYGGDARYGPGSNSSVSYLAAPTVF